MSSVHKQTLAKLIKECNELMIALFDDLCHTNSSIASAVKHFKNLVVFLFRIPPSNIIIPPTIDQLNLTDYLYFIDLWYQRFLWDYWCEEPEQFPQVCYPKFHAYYLITLLCFVSYI